MAGNSIFVNIKYYFTHAHPV